MRDKISAVSERFDNKPRGIAHVLSNAPDIGINEIAKKAFETATEKGFRDPDVAADRGVLGDLMLIVTEVAEAAEEARKIGYEPTRTYYRDSDKKPEGLPAELADVIIRIGDMAQALDIDLAVAVREKMAFNRSRPRLHGKTK